MMFLKRVHSGIAQSIVAMQWCHAGNASNSVHHLVQGYRHRQQLLLRFGYKYINVHRLA